MSKALIVYGSTTGNTESAAEVIEKVLKENGIETNLKSVVTASVSDLKEDYDLILLGSSTWGDDEIELQADFAEFYEAMDGIALDDKKVAVFGCGDSSYTYFCGAVDAIEEKVRKIGGITIVDPLKIDGDPDDADEEIADWASSIVGRM